MTTIKQESCTFAAAAGSLRLASLMRKGVTVPDGIGDTVSVPHHPGLLPRMFASAWRVRGGAILW